MKNNNLIVILPFIFLITLSVLITASVSGSDSPVIFKKRPVTSDYLGGQSVGATDLDQDGDVDIVIVENFNSKISWFENDGNYNYTENLIEDRDRTYPTAIMPVDLDKDDDIDLLVAEEGLYPSYDGSVVWFENDGSQHFTCHYIDSDCRGPNSLDIADLDHDGDMDVIAGSWALSDLAWYINDGNQNFTKYLINENYTGIISPLAIDLDQDGDMDFLAAASKSNEIIWFENDGLFNLTRNILIENFNQARSVHAIDLDNDEDLDIIVAAGDQNEIAWWENDGNQTFTKHSLKRHFEEAKLVYSVDLDFDNFQDVIGANTFSILWWHNKGGHEFNEYVVEPSFPNLTSIDLFDMDNDGDLDILACRDLGSEIAWWENQPNIGASLEMPSHEFHPGDDCYLKTEIYNYSGEDQTQIPFAVILEAYGEYWFYPDWTQDVGYEILDVPVGFTEKDIIETFPWPADVGMASGLHFFSLFLKPDLSDMLGVIESWEFGWRD